MAKSKNKTVQTNEAPIVDRTKALFDTKPPMCTKSGRMSDIDVYIKNSNAWVTVATTYSVDDIDAEDIADFITRAIQHYSQHLLGKE